MTYYRDQGWSITEGPEGFLLRRRHEAQAWMCVHGGTTVTVAVMVHGRRLVIANVGDSTALLAGVAADASVRPVAEWNDLSTASDKHSVAACGSAGVTAVTQLSCDHSPENESEFKRMRAFRPCQHRRHHPELLFVYDTLSSSKLSCPPIFSLDDAGNPHATGRGAYYKNVRNEWATLVAVPPFARFQDALAFTRSVGDFHLQTYGVSYVPTRWLWLWLWWRLLADFQRCACVVAVPATHQMWSGSTLVLRPSPRMQMAVALPLPVMTQARAPRLALRLRPLLSSCAATACGTTGSSKTWHSSSWIRHALRRLCPL